MSSRYTCLQGHSWPTSEGSDICPICGVRALGPTTAVMPEEEPMEPALEAEPVSVRRTPDPDEQPGAVAEPGPSLVAWVLGVLLALAFSAAIGVSLLWYSASAQRAEEARAHQELAEIKEKEALRAHELAVDNQHAAEEARQQVVLENQRAETALRQAKQARDRARELEGQIAQAREQARHETYLAQISRVEAIWDRDPARGLRLLRDTDMCPPEYRDFAWAFYRQLCTPERFAIKGHDQSVSVVAVSPRGDVGATVSEKTIKLWDLAGGKEKAALSGHSQFIHGLLFSPDGKLLASRCNNPGAVAGELNLWDVETGKLRAGLRGHRVPVTDMAFSQDGKRLVSCSGESNNLDGTPMEVKVWDTENGKESASFPSHARGQGFFAVALSPDGKHLAAGTGGTTQPGEILLFDLEAGKELTALKGHADWVTALAFTLDGKTLISAGRDGAVKLWDTETNKERTTLSGHGDLVVAVRVLPDGKSFASWTRSELKVWSLPAGNERFNLSAPLPTAYALAISNDSHTLALCMYNPEQLVEIGVYDLKTGEQRTSFKAQKLDPKADSRINVEALAFTPDGRGLFSGWTDGGVRLWNIRTSQESSTFKAHAPGEIVLAVSPGNKYLASGGSDRVVRLCQPETAQTALQALQGHSAPITSLAFSRDGKRLLSADRNRTDESGGVIKVWDVEKGVDTGARINDSAAPVLAIALAPNDDRLAWGNSRGDVKLISLSGKRPKVEFSNPGEVHGLAFSPDGKYLAVALADRTVNVWDVEAGQSRHILKGHRAPVNAVAFSPDGKLLASVAGERYVAPGETARPGELKIWDLASGTERLPVRGQIALRASAVAFSPDGKTIATGSADKMIKLWDVATGREEVTLIGHAAPITAVLFSPSGNLLFSASEDGTIKTWAGLPEEGEHRVNAPAKEPRPSGSGDSAPAP